MLAHQFQSQQQSSSQNASQPPPTIHTMRLRDEPPPVTAAPPRNSRKRKSPPAQGPPQHVLPPPHSLVHPPPHLQGPHPQLPQGFAYPPADYTPGGMPPQQQPPPTVPPDGQQQPAQASSPSGSATGRTLSSSKRAEQNRKAQRAFRERRDQHVKALESRSQLLDAALASADEANRRWEECRALVDQLRIENAALRAALSQSQMLPPGQANPNSAPATGGNNGAQQEEVRNPEESNEFKNDSSADNTQSESKGQ